MARFLTTTGVSYHLEEIIKGAQERLVVISPYLRINERIKALFEDRDRLKIRHERRLRKERTTARRDKLARVYGLHPNQLLQEPSRQVLPERESGTTDVDEPV